jgi:hypothetical protein
MKQDLEKIATILIIKEHKLRLNRRSFAVKKLKKQNKFDKENKKRV